jgi:hypothetical protein
LQLKKKAILVSRSHIFECFTVFLGIAINLENYIYAAIVYAWQGIVGDGLLFTSLRSANDSL